MDKKLDILFEDNHCIVVWKPAGMLVQGDATGDVTLMDHVKEYIKEKYKKTGNVFLGLVHRLDRPVSGVVIFAKTSKGASRLSEQFRNREVRKEYHAVVVGDMSKKYGIQKTHTIAGYISKDEKKGKALFSLSPFKDAVPAHLSFKVISISKNTSCICIDLGTGRFHQIRAQCAFIGYPLVGDVKYGGAKENEGSISLSSTALTFQTPTGGEQITVRHAPHFVV